MKEQNIRKAFDSVMLTQKEKEVLLQNILSASGHRPAERKRTMKYKKTLLIAAIVTAMAIFMGCAVVALSTKRLKLDEYQTTSPAWIDADGQRHEAAEVTKAVLSLQGIENTPEQKAAKEWYDFCRSYDSDHTIYVASQGKFQAPEEYDAYSVYSQEMVDKLTEIAKKYGLKLLGRKATAYTYDWQLGWDALGIKSCPVSGSTENCDLRGCTFFDSGSFSLWTAVSVTDPAFTWKNPVHLVLNYNAKGYLNTKFANVESNSVREWNYVRSDGKTVLIVLARDSVQSANDKLLLLCDRGDAFLYAQMSPDFYPNGSSGIREEMSDQDIEWLAEHIDFSIQPQKPDLDSILPILQKEDEAYDAMLEQDNPFRQDSYNQLRKVLGAVSEFALLDLDGDDMEECIFWDSAQNPQLFTRKDGKTVPVETQGEKAAGLQGTVSLCEGNILKTYEEVGQAYKLYCFYKVENGYLAEQNRLVYDIANDGWGLSLSGIHIDKMLTKEEAESILNGYREMPLEHLPIRDFPEDE